VREFYPDVRVLVADDSASPPMIPGVQNLVLPYDTGLSFGRNRMVERVETPFMFLMEDDAFVCDETDMERMLGIMERTDIDILGLTVVDMPKGFVHPNGYMIYIRGQYGYSELGSYGELEGCSICDFVENIFMARTSSLQAFEGWDERLKIHEHGDFFLRARGQLKVAFLPEPRIHHEHIEDPNYTKFRRGARSHKYRDRFFGKYSVVDWISADMGVPNGSKGKHEAVR